jgi:hypothetical protein
MKHLAFFLLVGVLSLLLAAAAPAQQAQPGKNYVSLKLGAYEPTGDVDDHFGGDTGVNIEAALGHYYSPYLAVEAGVGYFQSEGDFFISPGNRADVNVFAVPFKATVKGILPLEGLAELYGGVGIGLYVQEVEVRDAGAFDESINVALGGHVVAGVTADITSRVFFGVEGAYIFTDEDEISLFFAPVDTDLDGFKVSGVIGYRF